MFLEQRLDQVANPRRRGDESVQEKVEECNQHVVSFASDGNDRQKVMFKWFLTHMLAKCSSECARAVWEKKPKTPVEVIQVMRQWEAKHGLSIHQYPRRVQQPGC